MKLSKNLCFRLSKEQIRKIIEKSEELGMPKSTFCRMAVLTFMKGKIDQKEETSS